MRFISVIRTAVPSSVRTALVLVFLVAAAGCKNLNPPEQSGERLDLPQPGMWAPSAMPRAPDSPGSPGSPESPEVFKITARSLIPIAFHQHPDIRSSFHRFEAERSGYDFFIASNDALTLGLRSSLAYNSSRQKLEEPIGVVRDRSRGSEIAATVEKRFFDTTRLDMRTGFNRSEFNDDTGYSPFLAADLRYPLGPSREKLERTSQDIFRQNELIDAQLDYINVVRRRLERALEQYFEVIQQRANMVIAQEWSADLEKLASIMDSMTGRDLTNDERRVQAEMPRVTAEYRNAAGRFEVEVARLKDSTGLSYEAELDLDEEDDFQPFAGSTHEELRRSAVATDPEIATLRNSLRNSEVQLDLAQKGKWDIALLLGTLINLEGRGNRNDRSAHGATVGLEVSRVDSRVTDSLRRQALANIARFEKAILTREREIYVSTLEPLIRIDTLGQNRRELMDNLVRFRETYEEGLAAYQEGTLNIDDLLKRRETLFDQQEDINDLANLIGSNVAELMTATGKYFEILEEPLAAAP